MEALQVALGSGPTDNSLVASAFDKLRSGIKNPTRNRKLLGSWVPILLNGRRVATTASEGEALDAPLTVTFAKAGEPRIQIHRYGVFPDHLKEGEEIEVTVEGGDTDAVQRVRATANDNTRVALPLTLPEGDALHLGGVTHLSDYLLLAGDAQGVQDVFMRVSPASLDEPETNEPPKKFISRMKAKFPAARVSDPSGELEAA
jgi:hypothetical protein